MLLHEKPGCKTPLPPTLMHKTEHRRCAGESRRPTWESTGSQDRPPASQTISTCKCSSYWSTLKTSCVLRGQLGQTKYSNEKQKNPKTEQKHILVWWMWVMIHSYVLRTRDPSPHPSHLNSSLTHTHFWSPLTDTAFPHPARSSCKCQNPVSARLQIRPPPCGSPPSNHPPWTGGFPRWRAHSKLCLTLVAIFKMLLRD